MSLKFNEYLSDWEYGKYLRFHETEWRTFYEQQLKEYRLAEDPFAFLKALLDWVVEPYKVNKPEYAFRFYIWKMFDNQIT